MVDRDETQDESFFSGDYFAKENSPPKYTSLKARGKKPGDRKLITDT